MPVRPALLFRISRARPYSTVPQPDSSKVVREEVERLIKAWESKQRSKAESEARSATVSALAGVGIGLGGFVLFLWRNKINGMD
jgi:hypothetical protein